MKRIFLVLAIIITLSSCTTNSKENCSEKDSYEKMSPDAHSYSNGFNMDDEDYFVKIKMFYESMYCLTNNGWLLEYDFVTSSFSVIESNVKDFYSWDTNRFLILYNNNIVTYLDYKNTFYCPDAAYLEKDAIVTYDGTAFYFDYEKMQWIKLSQNIRKIFANTTKAIIIDCDNALKYYDYEKQETSTILNDIIDVEYYGENKTYYSSDIWYVTSNGELGVISSSYGKQSFASDSLMTGIKKIDAASSGYCLAKTLTDEYILISINADEKHEIIKTKGSSASLIEKSYSIIDADNPKIAHCHINVTNPYTFSNEFISKYQFPQDFTIECPQY